MCTVRTRKVTRVGLTAVGGACRDRGTRSRVLTLSVDAEMMVEGARWD